MTVVDSRRWMYVPYMGLISLNELKWLRRRNVLCNSHLTLSFGELGEKSQQGGPFETETAYSREKQQSFDGRSLE